MNFHENAELGTAIGQHISGEIQQSNSVVQHSQQTSGAALRCRVSLQKTFGSGNPLVYWAALGEETLRQVTIIFSFVAVTLLLSSCGGGVAPRVVPPSIKTQPASRIVLVGQSATFSVTATGTGPLTYQWLKGISKIAGATSASYLTPPATTSDNHAQYSVAVSDSAGNITSSIMATLTVGALTDVLTYHNDNARTGENLTELLLTSNNVNAAQFGKIGFYAVDGLVDAQPLVASEVAIPNNGTHNLLIAATENDSVYAFDADSGATLWHASVLRTGETPSNDTSCPACPLPVIGVNATPVIDRTRGPNGLIYVVASSKDGSGNYYHRLHALDLALGTELFGGPVDYSATYPGVGDDSDGTNVVFDPMQYRERSGLLLLNGVIYTGWASRYDLRPYTGWILGNSASTLAQTRVLNVTPNGYGGAIWMSSAGLAADSAGNIYFGAANGLFDDVLNASGFPARGNYGNAFMKLSTSNGLGVADYFVMSDEETQNDTDDDFGSGGVMVLPDVTDSSGRTLHLAVGAGKDTNIYIVNRDSMGKISDNNSNIYQELAGALSGGTWSMPAYFNNSVYYGSVSNVLQAFAVSNAKLSSSATEHTVNTFPYPGATPSISANGTENGIVWALENSTPAVLHAYDAYSLNELYNSNQASSSRDQFGAGNKFITPTIANGKVFVGTPQGVAVFGLLPQ
jgi:hypothetical protein